MPNTVYSVREANLNDIVLISNYWYSSTPSYLASMGADINKRPLRSDFEKMMEQVISESYDQKVSYALIWESNGLPVGHSNVNHIEYGNFAHMHLHLWQASNRQRGMGTVFVSQSLPFYFDKLKLANLICEPNAYNEAPNRTLMKVGFDFEKKYLTIPGSLNPEQEVNRWVLSRTKFDALRHGL